jgi:ACDE family multidrug resistance protein
MTRRPPAVLLFLTSIVGVSATSLITSSLPDIVEAFDVPDSAAGLVLGASTVPGIVLALVVGLAADRFGRKVLLVGSLLLFGAAGLASAFAPTFGVFLALRALQGAGSSALLNLTATVIGDHWSGTDRATMIGRNTAFVTVSIAILPTIGGVLTDTLGFRGPFYLFALAIPLGLAIAWRVPETELPPSGRFGEQLARAWRFVTTPRMLTIAATGVAVFVLLFGAELTVAPFHAEGVFGLSASARGLLLGVPAITATVVATVLGRLIGRFGRPRLVVAGALVYGTAFVVMGVAPAVWVFVLALLLVGSAEGFTIPVLQESTLAGAATENRGIAVAVFGSAARLGQSIGPAIAGLALVSVSTVTAFFGFALGAFVLAAFVWSVRSRFDVAVEAD